MVLGPPCYRLELPSSLVPHPRVQPSGACPAQCAFATQQQIGANVSMHLTPPDKLNKWIERVNDPPPRKRVLAQWSLFRHSAPQSKQKQLGAMVYPLRTHTKQAWSTTMVRSGMHEHKHDTAHQKQSASRCRESITTTPTDL